MANFGSLVIGLNANISGFTRGISQAQGVLGRLSNSLQGLGGGLALGGAALGIGAMVKDYADFEDAQLRVKATTKATADEMLLLTDRVHELARQSGVDQQSVLGIMLELGRANFNPQEINSVAEAVVNLSKASGSDAAKSGEVLSSMINAFGLSATDAVAVADKLTAAANGSQTNVEQLGEAMAYVGTIGKDMGVSMDETLAMMGVLGNLSTQGSMAGTSVRRLFLDMGAHAEQMRVVFGESFVDINGNFIGATRAMQIMAEATKNMAAPERLAKFEEAFGTLGVTAGSSLASMMDMYEQLKTEISSSTGLAESQAAEMESGVGGSIRRIGIAWTELTTSFISQWGDSIVWMLETFTSWIDGVSGGWNWLQNIFAEGFLVIITTWDWAMSNAHDLATYYTGLIVLVFSQMGDKIANVITWAGRVIHTVGLNMGDVFGVVVQNTWDNFKTLGENIKNIFKGVWAYIKNLGKGENLKIAWKPFKGELDGLVQRELPKFEDKASFITDMVASKVAEAASNLEKDTLGSRIEAAMAELALMQGGTIKEKPQWDPNKSPAFRGNPFEASTSPSALKGLQSLAADNQSALATAQLGQRGTSKAYDIIMKARDSKQLQFLGQIEKNTAEAVSAMKNLAGAAGMMGGAGSMFGVAEGLLN